MPRDYDCTRPWRDQLDEQAIEQMISTYAPRALERLGVERLLTVKRMIDEYRAGNLSRDELVVLAAHYDGLTVAPTPVGEDPEPAPAEGSCGWDVYMAGSHDLIDGELYDELLSSMKSDG
ncbi:hypothetical protein [Actinomyces howellii]|uniref:Uncharacterized protein n=1 Tax=Actinomyces howellii TaxID=52771 RepID=A0A448HFH7_9ACTO|nr:hypothetical protein [Actinomyces howellii]VEG27149.1 Uncharacterised protein [Actinomyces howellii]